MNFTLYELHLNFKNTPGTLEVTFTKIGKNRELPHVGEKEEFAHGKFQILVRHPSGFFR